MGVASDERNSQSTDDLLVDCINERVEHAVDKKFEE